MWRSSAFSFRRAEEKRQAFEVARLCRPAPGADHDRAAAEPSASARRRLTAGPGPDTCTRGYPASTRWAAPPGRSSPTCGRQSCSPAGGRCFRTGRPREPAWPDPDFPVRPMHVSTPRRKRPRWAGSPCMVGAPELDRQRHKGMPLTSIAQTMYDLATQGELKLVRKALAPTSTTRTACTRRRSARCAGRAATAAPRCNVAIDNYEQLFAQTQSPLEDDYIELCESLDIPKPDRISVRVLGIPVDAVYYDAMLIVELDGIANHHSPAQIRRNHRNDKKLRDAGWLVLRYTTDQLKEDPEGACAMADHSRADAASRAGWAGRTGAGGLAWRGWRPTSSRHTATSATSRRRLSPAAARTPRTARRTVPGSWSRSTTPRDCTGTCGSSTTGCSHRGRSRTGSRRRRRRAPPPRSGPRIT